MVAVVEHAARHGGYLFLFLISIVEAIPFIGAFVPGHTAVIVSGFLAKIGVFNLWVVMALASAGAILGDMIGFYLGRKYGMSLADKLMPYFFIRAEHIEKARAMVGKHTGKALIIGRFNPITRPLMPFIVGSSHSKIARFWIFNIIGGIMWATSSVLLGYVLGLGYHTAAGYLGRLVVAAVIAVILIVWGYRFVNMRFHIFKKYELFALGLNILSLWMLAKTIEDAWAAKSFMANFDIAVNIFMANHVTPFLAAISAVIGIVGGTVATGGLGILSGVVLAFNKKWRTASLFTLSTGSTGIILGMMKEFFMRARPVNALQHLTDPSFPSGHSGLAAAFFVILAYVLAPHIKNLAKREWMIVGCVLAIIIIGLSRVALNVHWSSDVIAGWSLGVFCATGSILFVRYAGALIAKKS